MLKKDLDKYCEKIVGNNKPVLCNYKQCKKCKKIKNSLNGVIIY